MALALLKGSARDKFQQTILTLDTDKKELPEEERKDRKVLFDIALHEVGQYEKERQNRYVQDTV